MLSKMEAIHARLVQRRRLLLGRYRDELARVEEELAQRDAETVERSTEEWDARVLATLGHTDLHAIVALNEAMRRLQEGAYGSCSHCEQPIDPARLEALPEAIACVDCAAAAEHGLERRVG
jgi:DnaK suppressor protein